MVAVPETNQQPLSAHDREELTRLVNTVALSEKSLTIYGIAPESAPDHPVIKAFEVRLKQELEEPLQFRTFFYSDNSLFNFLATLNSQLPPATGRRVIFAFGLEQLPKPRLKQELEQLNLGREKIFEQNLVLVFWLNRESFLNEFRNRAPDFWDWRGNMARFEQRHPLLYPYLEWLIAENSYLTMSGVMQVNRQVDIFLDQIYISLQAERRQQVTTTSKHQQVSSGMVTSLRQAGYRSHRNGENDLDDGLDIDYAPEPVLEMEQSILDIEADSTKTDTEKVDLADVVRSPYACSVILGAPGAGKTTLLKYLALHFARALRDNQDIVQGGTDQESLGQPRWPIYFKIADYAERLERHPDLGLLDYLQQFYRQWEDYFDGDDASALSIRLLERMERGNCLILLDGLDEVFDQASRRQIVGRINEFAEQFGHNKLIVTSRIAGYQDVKLASRFTEFTITDMSDEQVSDFLHRWCRAVEQAQKPEATAEQQEQEGNQQAEQILRDIKRNAGVKRLTTNPLLLTILALIHRNGERLPERRVKLYELAVQTLTADWQLSKKLPNAQQVLLPEGEVVELLAPLAYWMHEEKPSGQVTHTEVVEQLAPRLADLRGEAPESPEILAAVEEFLRRVRETTGLFVERAPDVYGFMHLTFEEYFAARDIADKDPTEILATIQQHWQEPRWVEPILLALGYYGSHSPRQVNRLVGKLFKPLDLYQPELDKDTIKLLGREAPNAQIQWVRAENPDEPQEFSLQELLFAGQVIAQVAEVNANRRKQLIEKLLVTGLALSIDSDDAEDSIVKQILQLLRQIEQFHQQGEVVETLQTFAQNGTLQKEMRIIAQVVKFYVLYGEASTNLMDCINELVEAMEPDLFCALMGLVNELGAEISPALEALPQAPAPDTEHGSLALMTAMTYVREKHYDQAIERFEQLSTTENPWLNPYIAWFLATCYQENENYEKADDFYQVCLQPLANCTAPIASLIYWKHRGICQRLHRKYEQALDYFQQMLSTAKEIPKPQEEASALYHVGRAYQSWGKYDKAIVQYEQSRDLYQQLGRESNVANQWGWLANTYRDWGKYEQALECRQHYLALHKELGNESNVALAHYHLGRIYQAWGNYEEAITLYEQSRDLYQQLEKEAGVAKQWYWIANCYKDQGKYEQAIEAQQNVLAIRQKLDDQSKIASACHHLGLIYHAWGKYAEAITHYEQSRDLYQQLERETNVANQWYWTAVCYREWGQYERALEAAQQGLAIHQKLDDQSKIANAYYGLGRIYQAWGKYSEAIDYYKLSRDRCQQLEKETDVAALWYWRGDCDEQQGNYEQAIASQQKVLAIRQKLGDQSEIALAYSQLGQIYQSWERYSEAINYHQQSYNLYGKLDLTQKVANQFSCLASCYRGSENYPTAIEYYKKSFEKHQALGHSESAARRLRQLANTQCLQAKTGSREEANTLLHQAESNLQQAIQLDTEGDYRENLAYDQIALALLVAEQLRWLPPEDNSIHEHITQFEQAAADGFARLSELGQVVARADAALDIARAYLEIELLENLVKAEDLARQSLKTFQELNRRKLQAAANKLLGKIYLARRRNHEPGAADTAANYLKASLTLYRDLDLAKKAAEVELLIN